MGFRTHEEEGAFDGMSLDEFLIENREATFIVRARGNLMKDAGIIDGDLLVVDKSKEPKPKDIVISVTEGSFKMRRMSSLIESKESSKVEAVVTAVIRKY